MVFKTPHVVSEFTLPFSSCPSVGPHVGNKGNNENGVHTMNDQIDRIIAALQNYKAQNHQQVIDEPANDFEKATNEWESLQALQQHVKQAIKPLAFIELEKRNAIAASLAHHFGDGLKEGVNNYMLSNGRKLKYKHSISRIIDQAAIGQAREGYVAAADTPDVAFDDLLRVKYELAVAPYKKVQGSPEAATAVSRMIISKPAAPALEVD